MDPSQIPPLQLLAMEVFRCQERLERLIRLQNWVQGQRQLTTTSHPISAYDPVNDSQLSPGPINYILLPQTPPMTGFNLQASNPVSYLEHPVHNACQARPITGPIDGSQPLQALSIANNADLMSSEGLQNAPPRLGSPFVLNNDRSSSVRNPPPPGSVKHNVDLFTPASFGLPAAPVGDPSSFQAFLGHDVSNEDNRNGLSSGPCYLNGNASFGPLHVRTNMLPANLYPSQLVNPVPQQMQSTNKLNNSTSVSQSTQIDYLHPQSGALSNHLNNPNADGTVYPNTASQNPGLEFVNTNVNRQSFALPSQAMVSANQPAFDLQNYGQPNFVNPTGRRDVQVCPPSNTANSLAMRIDEDGFWRRVNDSAIPLQQPAARAPIVASFLENNSNHLQAEQSLTNGLPLSTFLTHNTNAISPNLMGPATVPDPPLPATYSGDSNSFDWVRFTNANELPLHTPAPHPPNEAKPSISPEGSSPLTPLTESSFPSTGSPMRQDDPAPQLAKILFRRNGVSRILDIFGQPIAYITLGEVLSTTIPVCSKIENPHDVVMDCVGDLNVFFQVSGRFFFFVWMGVMRGGADGFFFRGFFGVFF